MSSRQAIFKRVLDKSLSDLNLITLLAGWYEISLDVSILGRRAKMLEAFNNGLQKEWDQVIAKLAPIKFADYGLKGVNR